MMNKENKNVKKTFWVELKEDWKNPTKRKIRSKNAMMMAGNIIRTFILIGLCFVILAPILQKLSIAFRHPSDISNPQVVWIPDGLSVINFQIAWELLEYSSSVWNTLILSVFVMLIQIMASAVAGYSFARLKFKGSNFLFFLVIFTLVVPNETLHISRNLFLTNFPFFGIKLVGSLFSMYILAAFGQGIRSAIFIFLFRQFFKNLPVELEESAQVDGAGVIRTFWSVMLPNARGAVVTVGLFAFVWQWNDLYFAGLLNDSLKFPLLASKLGDGTNRLDTVMGTWIAQGRDVLQSIGNSEIKTDPLFRSLIANTAALLMMLPLLIGYFFVQKQFVESIERTGIVG
ncbi:MAG TPA: carbohydrate ABC transporter permease [Bacilli bacterium]|nr:carbohydrate ABC transporter permease [Bacilli bacterium]